MSIRPSHRSTIAALLITDPRFPWVGPTHEEADIAAVLDHIEATHRGADDADADGCHWGTCSECGTPWPCERWAWSEQVAVLWLGRAADRVAAHAMTTIRPTGAEEARSNA